MSLRLYELSAEPGTALYTVVVAVELGAGDARDQAAVDRACADVVLADEAATCQAEMAWRASVRADGDAPPAARDVAAYLRAGSWRPLRLAAGRVVSGRFFGCLPADPIR